MAKDATEDTYHGTKVADPYRWLEDGESAEVRSWTDSQNAKTRSALDSIAGRPELRARVQKLLQVGFVSPPSVRKSKGGFRYFHARREGEQNQPTYYVRDGSGPDRILLDGSALSKDGTTAIDWLMPSRDGSLVAWGKSESGSEESVLQVRDVATGKDLTEAIPFTRHASVAWLPDGKAFYYSRYPTPGSVPAGDEKYFRKIFFHKLGTDSKDDVLVFGDGREKTDTPSVHLSPNGRWLVIRVHEGWQKSEVYLKDLALPTSGVGDKGPWVEVATGKDALFEAIPRDEALYMLTNDGSPRYRLDVVDYRKPERASWKPVLPEGKAVLEDVTLVGKTLVATFMDEAAARVERFDLRGKSQGELPLPTLGSAQVTGPEDGDEAFVGFVSFVVPSQILRYDLKGPAKAGGKGVLWDQVGQSFAMPGVKVTRAYATSKDGTKVPMFLVEKEGTAHDGKAAGLLYGYGGFNVNQTPAFSPRALAAVERGAVWASAILRGGGELGEDWHRAGMREKKQNVFDDFLACAETLVKDKIVAKSRLGIVGGSNGGLLVAAAITQRPELFRVGLSLVPLTDMLRYHHFRIGKLWVPEYGSSDDPEQFKALYAYSPYHRVKDGVAYPAMLLTTAESDSRVDPMHARKMAARLQEAQIDDTRAILLRVETKAGHGAGKPVSKLVDEYTDEMSFAFRELGL